MAYTHETGSARIERQPSPILSSNNPFRNRSTYSQQQAGHLTSPVENLSQALPERPTSRNPFLDQPAEKKLQASVSVRSISPPGRSTGHGKSGSPSRSPRKVSAADIFDKLSIDDSPPSRNLRKNVMIPPLRPVRAEDAPSTRVTSPRRHKPSRSQEDELPARPVPQSRKAAEERDLFADPPSKPKHRPRQRRNSDSSIASKTLKPEDDDRRRRDRARREKSSRHRADGKSGAAIVKGKQPVHRLDVIDSLDVTSIYGKGLFHHDGPFDACNPDRNRRGISQAPMEAFAAGSANNTIGGSGPLHKDLDFNQIHGRGAEGFTDFSTSGSHNPLVQPVSFETDSGSMATAQTESGVRSFEPDDTKAIIPNNRATILHGEETLGLGTSTFLEGAPAARTAIQRREADSDGQLGVGHNTNGASGLGRKRSLAQRIRGISNANRDRVTRQPPVQILESESTTDKPFPVRGESQSAGGMSRLRDAKPFFNDYDAEYAKKSQQSKAAEERRRRLAGNNTFDAPAFDRRGSIGSGEDEFNNKSEAVAQARRERVVPPPRPSGPANSLQRSITSDGSGSKTSGFASTFETMSRSDRKTSVTSNGQSNIAGSGLTTSPTSSGGAGGGGFLKRVKSLKGGKKRP